MDNPPNLFAIHQCLLKVACYKGSFWKTRILWTRNTTETTTSLMVAPFMAEKHQAGGSRKATLVVGVWNGVILCAQSTPGLADRLSDRSNECCICVQQVLSTLAGQNLNISQPHVMRVVHLTAPHICSLVFSWGAFSLCCSLLLYSTPTNPTSGPQIVLHLHPYLGSTFCVRVQKMSLVEHISLVSLFSGVTAYCPMSEIVASYTVFSGCL